jgi:hypothetical protein
MYHGPSHWPCLTWNQTCTLLLYNKCAEKHFRKTENTRLFSLLNGILGATSIDFNSVNIGNDSILCLQSSGLIMSQVQAYTNLKQHSSHEITARLIMFTCQYDTALYKHQWKQFKNFKLHGLHPVVYHITH